MNLHKFVLLSLWIVVGHGHVLRINAEQKSIVSVDDEIPADEALFDNKYSEKLSQESNPTVKGFPHGPHYEIHWYFIDSDNIRIEFALFSLHKLRQSQTSIHLLPSMASAVSSSLTSINSLHYFLFTIRQYKTETEILLDIKPLIHKERSAENAEHLFSALTLVRLNVGERYSICIYYYENNRSISRPDLFVCQDIINDYLTYSHNKSDSKYGILFILTQYSIIFVILVLLQSLLSMRKRRIADIVHQHFINKTQRFRLSFSSISLVRQSVSSADMVVGTDVFHSDEQLAKNTNPSDSSSHTVTNVDENETFMKIASNKNHVQFLLGEGEESDSLDESESRKTEPYGDRSDALLSMAHILDSDKPWYKYKRPSICVY